MKTKYKGVYKTNYKTKENMYYYSTKIKNDLGEWKSVKSDPIYDNPLLCYKDLIELKNNNSIINTTNVKDENKINKNKYNNTNSNNNNLLLISTVAKNYLDYIKTTNKESTWINYKCKINKYIVDFFGPKAYVKDIVNIDTLNEYMNHISNLTVNNYTKNLIISLLVNLLERAFYLSAISQSEFGLAKLTLTTIKDISIHTVKEKKEIYTEDEFIKFLSSIDEKNKIFKFLFSLLFYGGFRISELLAITPQDVKDGYISINKQIIQFSHKVGTTKNKKGIRKVPIKKSLYAEFVDFIKEEKIDPNERIFNINYSFVRIKNKEFAEKAGIEQINIHGFRHSCCSLLIQKYIERNLSINFKKIANFLGHSVEQTLNTYSHLYKSEDEKIIDLLG